MLKTKVSGETSPVTAGEPVGFEHEHRSGCHHLVDHSLKNNRLPGSGKPANVDEAMCYQAIVNCGREAGAWLRVTSKSYDLVSLDVDTVNLRRDVADDAGGKLADHS